MKHLPILRAVMALTLLLGIQKGQVALWQEGNPTPIQVFPYRAETLPPKIFQSLQQGIKVDEKSELYRILENYLS